MPDPADYGSKAEAEFTNGALAAHANRRRPANTTIYCLNPDCGEEIPKARREAAPGCEYCIDCQREAARGGRFWG